MDTRVHVVGDTAYSVQGGWDNSMDKEEQWGEGKHREAARLLRMENSGDAPLRDWRTCYSDGGISETNDWTTVVACNGKMGDRDDSCTDHTGSERMDLMMTMRVGCSHEDIAAAMQVHSSYPLGYRYYWCFVIPNGGQCALHMLEATVDLCRRNRMRNERLRSNFS